MARRKIVRTITDRAGLHSETVSGAPLLEISSDDRVLVENYLCVVEYTECLVQIRMEFGMYEIAGSSLMISCIQKDQLVVCGRIDSVTLRRG